MANYHLRDEASELRRIALALATLALVGFSLVLTGQMSWLTSELRNDFAEHNTLGEHGRSLLLASLAAGLALPAVVGLLLLRRRREIGVLERAATLGAPLGLLFIVPGLFLSPIAADKPLYYLVVLAAFGLVFNALLAGVFGLLEARPSAPLQRLGSLAWLQRIKQASLPRGVPLALVLLSAAGYAYVLGGYAVAHHRLIQDVATDVGIPDNVMANLLRRRYFKAPAQFGTGAGNYLTVHAEFGSLLFVPIYALRPGVETLCWLQAIVAALAVIPLYLVAARQLGRSAAVWVSFAYLLVAPLHGALLAGFSWLPAVTLFTFTLYYAIESERRLLLALTLCALLLISEAGPLYAFALGLMLIGSRTKTSTGVWLVVLALPLIIFDFALSAHGSGALENPPLLTAVSTFWKNPVYFVWDLARATKVTSLLHALAPLCLLPLLELACWPLLIPGVLFTSAGSVFWPNGSAGFINSVIWVPGSFIALLFVLQKRRERGPGRTAYLATVLTLTITLLSHSYNYGALLRKDGFGGAPAGAMRMTPWGQSRYDALRQVLVRIPVSASVGVTTYLLSHVSNRPDVFDLSRPYGQPDYILVSSREVGAVRSQLTATFAKRQYELVLSKFDEFYLFTRAPETPDTRLALTRLGLSTP